MTDKVTDPTSWFELVRQEYANGASDMEVCKVMNVTKQTFDEYYRKDSNFKKFIDLGRMLSVAWWENQGRKNLQNRAFNTALWSFNMKNRHGWTDRVDTTTDAPRQSESIDQLREKIRRFQEKMLREQGLNEAQIVEKTSH